MKKKLLILSMLFMFVFGLSACGKNTIKLQDYLIEDRDNLYTAQDSLYCVTFSTGMREENYNFDGVVNNKVEFGVLTLMRNDSNPLANDTYSYTLTINDEQLSGIMEKSPIDNSYAVDVEKKVDNNATISVQINFTGYKFNQNLTNTSSQFSIDKNAALDCANTELKDEIKNISNTHNKFEVVLKILKDFSNLENCKYYWYVGVVATDGQTLGILIDSNSGEIVAKKV